MPTRTDSLRREAALALAVAAVVGGALISSSCAKGSAASKGQSYEFATVSRGSIESVVSSSGTLAVVTSVSVLAQMSGRIEKVYVDYNAQVKKGQVLATINTDLLKLQADVAQAAVDKAQANYDLQSLAVKNAQSLSTKGLLSTYDLKTSQSTLAVYKAERSSAKAGLAQIATQINQYSIITSPMAGVVLARDVDAGQSVVGGSSATSTSLFTIAGDLAKMQIKAEVDELDIGSIKIGQAVNFTVEAAPGVAFQGSVKEIRLVPETSDSVVYYDVIILADNASGKLLPGMTATVNFIVDKKDKVLLVPSAALRFTPSTLNAAELKKALYLAGLGALTKDAKAKASTSYDEAQKKISATEAKTTSRTSSGLSGLSSLVTGGGSMGGTARQAGAASSTTAAKSAASSSTATAAKKALWYLDDDGKLAATMVEVGVSDSTNTQIVGSESLESEKVILKVKV